MLELSYGEIGWDVFTLEYKIDAPVDVVVTPYGSRQYLKVFNFLWISHWWCNDRRSFAFGNPCLIWRTQRLPLISHFRLLRLPAPRE